MSKPFLTLVKDEETPESKEARRASAISELFDLARRGEIPRSRELLAHEPLQLNERHLLAIMMRCNGARQTDIAAALNYTDSTVSIILNHPDATYIIDRLQAFSGVDVTDIDSRLKRLTSKAVDAIEAVFDEEDDPKAVNARVQKARLGFSLLEHTGNGPKKEVKHNHQHQITVGGGAAALLSRALRESSEIEEAEYTIEQGPGGGVEGSGPPKALPSGAEAPPLGASQGLPVDPRAN